LEEYRVTNRGGKGVKTINVTDKTGKLVAIKSVTNENDLMIINKSGVAIRIKVSDLGIIGRATQGVRLINLEKRNDEIASVCKVVSEEDVESAENSALEDAAETSNSGEEETLAGLLNDESLNEEDTNEEISDDEDSIE
jgi:DNA gyrase subunit A